MGGIGLTQNVLDLLQGKSQLAGFFGKHQTLKILVPIQLIAVVRIPLGRQQPLACIKAHRVGTDSGPLGQLTDFQHGILLSLNSTSLAPSLWASLKPMSKTQVKGFGFWRVKKKKPQDAGYRQ